METHAHAREKLQFVCCVYVNAVLKNATTTTTTTTVTIKAIQPPWLNTIWQNIKTFCCLQ